MIADEGDITLDLTQFPDRSQLGKPRPLFFDRSLTPQDKAILKARGYVPNVLMEMNRETDRENQDYLFALLQGMTEGTIPVDKARLAAAELELKARQMLHAGFTPAPESKEETKDLEAIWNWNPSRHTLQGNTTVVDTSVKKVEDALDAAPRKGRSKRNV